MEVAAGILTSRGGMTSHAAVVTRGMGKCCVAGAGDIHVDEKKREMQAKGQTFKGGDWISLDGTTGRVIKGKLDSIPPKADDPELLKFMGWAEPFRTMTGRPNADIPRDAIQARDLAPRELAFAALKVRCSLAKKSCRAAAPDYGRDRNRDRRAALKNLLPIANAKILTAYSGRWTVFQSRFARWILLYTNFCRGAKT